DQNGIRNSHPHHHPVLGTGARELAPDEESRLTEMYAELCNWFWYHDHPEYPRDGWLQASDVCRRNAEEVFGILGLTALLEPSTKRWFAALRPEARNRLLAYVGHDDPRRLSSASGDL